jgi:hypothetical protein
MINVSFNFFALYLFIGFYCLAIFIDYLILNNYLFLFIKNKYLSFRNYSLIIHFIFFFTIFFNLYSKYYIIVIDTNFNIINFIIAMKNNIGTYNVSISSRDLNHLLVAIISAAGITYGLVIAKFVNGSFFINLITGFVIITIYHLYSICLN